MVAVDKDAVGGKLMGEEAEAVAAVKVVEAKAKEDVTQFKSTGTSYLPILTLMAA